MRPRHDLRDRVGSGASRCYQGSPTSAQTLGLDRDGCPFGRHPSGEPPESMPRRALPPRRLPRSRDPLSRRRDRAGAASLAGDRGRPPQRRPAIGRPGTQSMPSRPGDYLVVEDSGRQTRDALAAFDAAHLGRNTRSTRATRISSGAMRPAPTIRFSSGRRRLFIASTSIDVEPGRELGENAAPVAERVLAQQRRGRIPGRIAASAQPAKISRIGQQQQQRPAERTGKMGDRGIDRDHCIKPRDHGGGRGEILQLIVDAHHIRAVTQDCVVAVAQRRAAGETEAQSRVAQHRGEGGRAAASG